MNGSMVATRLVFGWALTITIIRKRINRTAVAAKVQHKAVAKAKSKAMAAHHQSSAIAAHHRPQTRRIIVRTRGAASLASEEIMHCVLHPTALVLDRLIVGCSMALASEEIMHCVFDCSMAWPALCKAHKV